MVGMLLRSLLRSPLHGLVSRGIMLLTVRGRTSGRSYTFPVQYAELDGTLIVLAGRADTKRWWRNLRSPARVQIRLRGRDVEGTGTVIASPTERARAWRAYVHRFPRSVRSLGSPELPGDDAGRRADGSVFVRVDLISASEPTT